jgi:hypothetical protein
MVCHSNSLNVLVTIPTLWPKNLHRLNYKFFQHFYRLLPPKIILPRNLSSYFCLHHCFRCPQWTEKVNNKFIGTEKLAIFTAMLRKFFSLSIWVVAQFFRVVTSHSTTAHCHGTHSHSMARWKKWEKATAAVAW